MDRNILRTERYLTEDEARKALKSEPKWLVIDGSKGPTSLMPAVDLARFLEDSEKRLKTEDRTLPEQIDLMNIPANRTQPDAGAISGHA